MTHLEYEPRIVWTQLFIVIRRERQERIFTANIDEEQFMRFTLALISKENVLLITGVASFFSFSNTTFFPRMRVYMAKLREHMLIHLHLSCSMFVLVYSQRITTISVNPALVNRGGVNLVNSSSSICATDTHFKPFSVNKDKCKPGFRCTIVTCFQEYENIFKVYLRPLSITCLIVFSDRGCCSCSYS